MEEQKDYLEDISQIRNMMEQSSRFISLSGLSGIFAGVYALIGAYTAHYLIWQSGLSKLKNGYAYATLNLQLALYAVAGTVFILAIATGIYFTTKKAKKQGLKSWDSTTQRLIINLLIPLVTGGVFCLVLINKGIYSIIAPSTLIFYGLALVNASKYTFRDIRFLGLLEIVLGLISSLYPGNGILYMAVGFGIFHIIYGVVMYIKYEK
ncbi:MAG: hypothetical protein JXQ96_08260 [Cyclobacteriaceae bacterium]